MAQKPEWIKIELGVSEPPIGKEALFSGVYGGKFLGTYAGNGTAHTGTDCNRRVSAWYPIPPEKYVDAEAVARYEKLRDDYCKGRWS